MKRLIYQVCLGEQRNSSLYAHCIESVSRYCELHGIKHVIQTKPKLMIKPDIFASNRSEDSYKKHGGFLPIYEKENAFDLLNEYDQIAIIDADIFIRDDAPNIFDDFGVTDAWGGVVEREMPITEEYKRKILNYSHMQYDVLHRKGVGDFKPNKGGYEFFNMGMIVINSKLLLPYLNGQDAHTFINRLEFKDFVDGVGAWKWSTDQTLLNYFLKRHNVSTKHLSYKWNALYKGVRDKEIPEAHFIHFFLKDKLPARGENVKQLMDDIHGCA